ncbi:MAG: twin-arginine translocation signal domain-containing protein [Spirochaetaceae bacterium]|nr:MAG: twin-arginine translocation signal domain-containing protein [Spirochaetaceae bacterium]
MALNGGSTRRDFLKRAGVAAVGMGLALTHPLVARDAFVGEEGRPDPGSMPCRPLGRTGAKVALFSLGGEATVQNRQRRRDATAIINRALDLGVNYIDTSPTYGGGGSESNIGDVLQDRREEVFLATKTHSRTYDGTMRLVEESLKRLRTDRIDLYQIHNVRLPSDLATALGPGGALKALEELRSAGVIRFTGITGHRDPDVLLRGIREYPFDSLLMTLNAADIHERPFQKELLREAVRREMGVIAMKVTAVGRIFREGGITSMEEALGYTLSFPVSTAIVGVSNLRELEQNVQVARRFTPYAEAEKARIESLTLPYAAEGNFFKHHW